MSAHASPLLKAEVAKDGVVRIPKTVFATLPPAAPPSNKTVVKEGGLKEHTVTRLDGTVEVVTTGLPPDNPNFKPRQTVWGGKIVTNDKLEARGFRSLFSNQMLSPAPASRATLGAGSAQVLRA